MQKKELDYVPVGQVKRHRRNWLRTAGKTAADCICIASLLVAGGCLAGIGFGWGLALWSVWAM